jgi:nitroreductase
MSMETWDAVTARRNVRDYSDKEIPDAVLERILEAGRRAPSASNTQPWAFVLVKGRARLEELSKVWQGAGHVARSNATIAVVTPVPENERRGQLNQFDLGQATMAMMMIAADAGVGSGHSAVGDQDLARRLLGLPDNEICAYLIALGYPADRPLTPLKRPNRRPLEEVVHRDRW